MKQLTSRPYALCLLILLLCATAISCHKPHDSPVPPTPPHPPIPVKDSLGSWQLLRDTTAGGTPGIDIWFTSTTKGFFLGTDLRVYQTSDGGMNWTQNAVVAPSDLENLFFVNAQYGFAQATKHLLVTRDGGTTWAIKQINGINNFHLFFVSPSIGFSATADGILLKTTDTGNTWSTVRSGDLQPGVVPWFFDDQHGILLVSGNGHVDTTQSGGKSWQNVGSVTVSNAQGSFNSLQFIDAQHGFYASADGLLRTVNGGLNWNSTHAGGKTIDLVQFSDANNGFFSADSVIYQTTDGGQTWSQSCKVVGGDRFFGLHFIDAHTGWACSAKGLILHLQQ